MMAWFVCLHTARFEGGFLLIWAWIGHQGLVRFWCLFVYENVKQCIDATKFDCTCAGCWPEQWVLSNLEVSPVYEIRGSLQVKTG